jgi:hypothetical protein
MLEESDYRKIAAVTEWKYLKREIKYAVPVRRRRSFRPNRHDSSLSESFHRAKISFRKCPGVWSVPVAEFTSRRLGFHVQGPGSKGVVDHCDHALVG